MASTDQIELQLDVDPISLDVSTLVPLALIINELITNSLKYAFEQHEAGKIKLSLKPTENNKLLLQVQDNGKGFNHLEKFRWLWHQVDFTLAAKLDATVNYLNQNGTLVEVSIANFKLVP